jgi:hypothetical protein
MPDVSGLVDAHVHTGPEHIPRRMDIIDLAREARDAGMAGLLVKSHTSLTADRAQIAMNVVPGIHIWGGLVLNRWCGGMNPAAVENAIAYGAAEIWLPTMDAANDHRHYGKSGPDIAIEESRELHEILDLIAKHDLILGTGHAGPQEISLIVKLARGHGVKKILITHVEAPFIALPVETQKEFARLGCLLERTWVFTTPALNSQLEPECVVAGLRAVGCECSVLATDMGQVANPSPVMGFRDYVAACAATGFSDREILRMGRENIEAWLPRIPNSA